jgi:mRNA interferase YafQ
MRRIERTNAFRRDFKREKKEQYRNDLDSLVSDVLTFRVEDAPLPEKHRDHVLGGNWKDYRECHLRPDLLLIYRKPDAEVLQLIRLGSHSELFG